MTRFEMMSKVLSDDLKDAEMTIDYAYCLRSGGDKELADTMASRANERLSHFEKCWETFTVKAKEDLEELKKSVKDY